jgi:hypothetical protein
MNKQLEQFLFEKFPRMFKNKHDTRKSLMKYGFPGDGWFIIIHHLMIKINDLLDDYDDFEVVQVKEKFGGLRFYYRLENKRFKFRFPYKFNFKTKFKIQRLCDNIRNKIGLTTKNEKIDKLIQEAEQLCLVTCEYCAKLKENCKCEH